MLTAVLLGLLVRIIRKCFGGMLAVWRCWFLSLRKTTLLTRGLGLWVAGFCCGGGFDMLLPERCANMTDCVAGVGRGQMQLPMDWTFADSLQTARYAPEACNHEVT
jgi:hypothetical protein